MSISKSFAARLAALEALEQQQQTVAGDSLPSVALLSDQDVAWEATIAIRSGGIRVELSAPCGHVRLVPQWSAPFYGSFYIDVAARAEALFANVEKPLILLHPVEAEQAIQAIDTGLVIVTASEYQRGADIVRQFFRLWPRWPQAGEAYDPELMETLRAVATAHDLVNRQMCYPQPRNYAEPELETIEAWRQWLEGVLDGNEYQHERGRDGRRQARHMAYLRCVRTVAEPEPDARHCDA